MTVRQVGIDEGIRLRDAGYRVVDVREAHEWAAGHIAGATHIPLGEVVARAPSELSDRDEPLLLQCHSGARSGRAAAYLAGQGYTNLVNLDALIDDWAPAGGEWEGSSAGLTPAQEARYGRQVLMPEVGVEGQRRLMEASVLIVGAGGLGSPVALYLAAAGIGRIGLVDDDRVELSNLQRQVIHATDRVGMAKVESARRTLAALNPEIRVEPHPERLETSNVDGLVAGHDIVIDGTDSLETRYLLNDAAVRARTPVVHAAVYRWEAVVSTFVPFEGPCYRCLHPDQPPPELAPSCDVAGVMGVLPGLAGMLQATEVLKLVLRTGEPLVGRLLTIDAAGSRFDEIAIPRDPDCPACGTAAAVAPVG